MQLVFIAILAFSFFVERMFSKDTNEELRYTVEVLTCEISALKAKINRQVTISSSDLETFPQIKKNEVRIDSRDLIPVRKGIIYTPSFS